MNTRESRTRTNFFYLFGALLLLSVLGPVLAASLDGLGVLVHDLSLSVALVVALWSLHSSRRTLTVGIVLVGVNIVATATGLWLANRVAGVIADLSGLLFLVLCAVTATRQVFRRERVDANKIVGALCIYVLIAVIWAVAFHLLESFSPGSFSGLESHQGAALYWRLLYFSFVTVTTLGYGDVLPLTIYAESLTYMEAVLGQFYVAVIVAVLIGSYLSDRETSHSPRTYGPTASEE